MSKKIKITADAVLDIILGIFNDDDINTAITDPSAPPSWKDKTVQEVLNVEYYTFKHRPISSQDVINKALAETGGASTLAAADRAFCLLSLSGIERLFSKDVDMAVITASLEFYLQTNKIKLLEYLIEDCNIATSGLRIPVTFGEGDNAQTRKAVIVFGRPNIGDIQTASNLGETALVDIEVSLLLYPDVISYSEYTVSFDFTSGSGELVQNCAVPLSSFSVVNTMTQKCLPLVGNSRKVGNINLSSANSFVLVFDGYNNPFINYVAGIALSEPKDKQDNNQSFLMTIKRGESTYKHEVVIKDHQIIVNDDTGNESHTLALVTRGI